MVITTITISFCWNTKYENRYCCRTRNIRSFGVIKKRDNNCQLDGFYGKTFDATCLRNAESYDMNQIVYNFQCLSIDMEVYINDTTAFVQIYSFRRPRGFGQRRDARIFIHSLEH